MKRKAGLGLGLYVLAMSGAAQAGSETGNGGDAIVCSPGTGRPQVEMLDLYEAREDRHMVLALGAPELSVEEKIELALKRLERLDPERANRYRAQAATFEKEANHRSNVQLRDINDSLEIGIPEGCTLAQAIIQQKVRFDEDSRYTIDEDVYAQMDNDSKAVAWLHEITYREAIEMWNQPDSRNSRYLNSLIFSDKLETLTMREYVTKLANAGFGIHIRAAWRDSKTLELYEDGTLRSAIIGPEDSDSFVLVGRRLSLLPGERVVYTRKGAIHVNETLAANSGLRDAALDLANQNQAGFRACPAHFFPLHFRDNKKVKGSNAGAELDGGGWNPNVSGEMNISRAAKAAPHRRLYQEQQTLCLPPGENLLIVNCVKDILMDIPFSVDVFVNRSGGAQTRWTLESQSMRSWIVSVSTTGEFSWREFSQPGKKTMFGVPRSN